MEIKFIENYLSRSLTIYILLHSFFEILKTDYSCLCIMYCMYVFINIGQVHKLKLYTNSFVFFLVPREPSRGKHAILSHIINKVPNTHTTVSSWTIDTT